MRPKLHHYVYWRASETGVLFRGLSGTVQLRGEELAPWVRRLVRMLDGSRPWASRMKGRPPAEIAFWDSLLQPLLTARLVVDLDQAEPDHLSRAERERYRTVLDFLGEWADSPAARFEQVRQIPVFLHAEGLLGAIALRALVEVGVGEILYRADPVAADLIGAYLAPYQDWPVQLRPAAAPMPLETVGALLWAGAPGTAASEAASAAAAQAGIPLLTAGMTQTDSPVLAALGGCRLAHAWFALATGLPPLAPVATLEEVLTDVQARAEEGAVSVRPYPQVQWPAAAQG